MIDPTDSEIWFVYWLVIEPRGEATLQGSIAVLGIVLRDLDHGQNRAAP